MTKLSTFLLLLFVGSMASLPLAGQNDLLKGMFEKEAPEFKSAILPTAERGVVRLAVYFTHSRQDELEISFWIKDNGTLMHADGNKQLVGDLQKLGNRQQDTIYISGLKEQHVYTIGADFRKPQGLSPKFSSQDLLQGYRYIYSEPMKPATARVVDAMAKSPDAGAPVRPSMDCQDPIIDVRVDPAGYCGAENRPAVLVQCANCQGKNWEFSVEVRAAAGNWQPLRYDGQRQPAVGLGLRTEPLCTLYPGTYQVQVLAWGENCPNPVVKSLGTNIVIPHPQLEQPQVVSKPMTQGSISNSTKLPDTCFVEGQALLDNNVIKGTLTMSAYSPCADLRPYAEIVYVHPGHRNVTLSNVPLLPGAAVPFKIPLDKRDLTRGIHTIQVVAYVKENPSAEGVPLESFWLRATTPQELSASASSELMGGSSSVPVSPQQPAYRQANDQVGAYEEIQSGKSVDFEETPRSAAAPATATPSAAEDMYIDPALMETTINEVQVTATDPNCTPIQDLRVIFDSNQPTRPLFISWLNPRCCQVEGCTYTVWSGPDPKQLSLLMKGKKAGAVISEVLQGANSRDQYYEVVVETGNGVRKAAYALGTGPLYGLEEILGYHDMLYPPAPARVEAIRETGGPETATKSGEVESAVLLNPVMPELPISGFETCKYSRQTTLIGDQPVKVGQEFTLKYDFNDKRYQYTLYHQPAGMEEWVIAPGTQELQASPVFTIRAQPYHTGKYVILTYKPSSGGSGWGCLGTSLEDALQVQVKE